MAPYTKPDDQLNEEQVFAILADAVPSYAYRAAPRQWTWTRPTGVWHLNVVFVPGNDTSVKAHLEGSPSLLQICVRTTRREVDAALRFLVAVGAIDRHPDDPVAEPGR